MLHDDNVIFHLLSDLGVRLQCGESTLWQCVALVELMPCETGKVMMLHRLMCGNASLWLVHQELVQQVHTRLTKLLCRVADVLPAFSLEVGIDMEVRQAPSAKSWPLLLGGSAQFLKYLHDGTNLGITSKECVAGSHLCQDTAHTPDVYRQTIQRLSEQYLWSPVPNCHYLMRVLWTRNGKQPGKAKVRYLQHPVPCYEQVVRLQVAMQDPAGVAECHAHAELVSELFDFLRVQEIRLAFHVLLQIELDKLEYQGDRVSGDEGIDQLYNVPMRQLLQQGYLSQRRCWHSLFLTIHLHLLNGHNLVTVSACALVDFTIGAFTQDSCLLNIILPVKNPLSLRIDIMVSIEAV
mmetsp:Transcript_5098/g.8910  ORF Transcript_5098/g.8910 Transcript_5098/m.8910 type:complete len:350 (-) Transcript_5098:69-1118(-)